MGMLLCEQNVRDVWSRIVRAEIGQILHTHAAKLVLEIYDCITNSRMTQSIENLYFHCGPMTAILAAINCKSDE